VSETWRLIDSGIRRAAENFAMNRAILEAHQEGAAPHTLRFVRFQPCALLGFHQNVHQELNLDYVRAHGIDVQRRITGGGAIYFSPEQLGWELYLDKKVLGTADMNAIAGRICGAAARAVRELGVDARFRPRNDIEVAGRKISGTGGAFDGDSILYQGTLLVQFDVERMVSVLRIPGEKLRDKAIESAAERVVSLEDLLGEVPPMDRIKSLVAGGFATEFGVVFEPAMDLTPRERDLYAEALVEIDSDEWIYQRDRPSTEASLRETIYRCEGGTMRVGAAVDESRDHLKQIWITGDFFVTPQRLVVDLEAALKDTPVADLDGNVRRFFSDYPVRVMLMLKAEDFAAAIRQAIAGEVAG